MHQRDCWHTYSRNSSRRLLAEPQGRLGLGLEVVWELGLGLGQVVLWLCMQAELGQVLLWLCMQAEPYVLHIESVHV